MYTSEGKIWDKHFRGTGSHGRQGALGRHSLGLSLLCPAVPDKTMVLIGTHWLSNKYYPRELGKKGSMQEKSDKDLGETRTSYMVVILGQLIYKVRFQMEEMRE